MKANTAGRVYEKAVDRVSAHEILGKRAADLAAAEEREEAQAARDKEAAKASRTRSTGGGTTRAPRTTRSSSSRTTPLERQGGRVASGVFNTIVRELMRGILGTPSRRRR